jgi:branched-chain amino acid transport system permease protein
MAEKRANGSSTRCWRWACWRCRWWRCWINEPFYITLATRVAILALAAVGLNLALGLGGMVSFGHAAYFGLGGYVAGIMAHHAFAGTPICGGPAGSNQMLVIWAVAMVLSGLLALVIGALSLRTSGIFFIMITLAFAQMIFYFALSWPAYGGEDGLPIFVRNQFPGLNTMRPWDMFLLSYGVLMVALASSRCCARAVRRGADGDPAEPGPGGGGGHLALRREAGGLRDLGHDHRAGRAR